jgi:hypothetical protein
MNTLNLDHLANVPVKATTENTGTNKFADFVNSQSKNKTGWFLFSLLFQGVLFLPIPAALMFYYNAPIYVLAVTLIFFFANLIAGMGGSSIRVLINLFGASVLVHLLMMAVYMLR